MGDPVTQYLIFPDRSAARARSRSAYSGIRQAADEEPAGTVTVALWASTRTAGDGRVALSIPDTPEAAHVDMSQADYDALLTPTERAALVPELPEDWDAEAPTNG